MIKNFEKPFGMKHISLLAPLIQRILFVLVGVALSRAQSKNHGNLNSENLDVGERLIEVLCPEGQ